MQLAYSRIELVHMMDTKRLMGTGSTREMDLLSLFPNWEFWRRQRQNLLGGVEWKHG